MYKKALLFFVVGLFLFVPSISFAEENPILFYGQGCPHCSVVNEYINNEDVNLERKELYFNPDNAVLFNDLCDKAAVPLMERGVPMMFIGDEYFVGDIEIIGFFEEDGLNEPIVETEVNTNDNNNISIWVVLAAAMVDAINPCAFAVLIILLSTILLNNNRKRVLAYGFMFCLSIFLSYLLMGIGLYKALFLTGFSFWFRNIIAILAIIIGLFNLKDYFWYGKGFLMEVPMSWRPRLKSLISGITNPISAFIIGFLVSLFLLPCTSGPYIVILGLLGSTEAFYSALGYLVFYNLVFILPMMLITILVYFGIKPNSIEGIRQNKIRILHLIAGIVMVSIGLYLLVF